MRIARILGTGSALPGAPVSNDELARRLALSGVETSDAWIQERTGIRQRYLADATTTTSLLATQAALAALEDSGLQAKQLDLIIVATSTPDLIFPSTACLVQKALGCPGGAAFDVQAVCAGFAYGLATANAMLQTGLASRALVIGAEVFSGIMDWTDRGTCVLFGDGAGAVVLEAVEPGGASNAGILAARLHADGRLDGILNTPGQVRNGAVTGHPFLKMDGQAVFKQAVSVLDAVARETVEAAGLPLSAVDWLIPHQANVRILQATGRKLGLPPEKVVVTVDQHANTSAASVPLALDVARRDGRIQPGHVVLMQGVGGGFTWGAVLARM